MKVTHTAPNKGPRVKSTDTTEENQRDDCSEASDE